MSVFTRISDDVALDYACDYPTGAIGRTMIRLTESDPKDCVSIRDGEVVYRHPPEAEKGKEDKPSRYVKKYLREDGFGFVDNKYALAELYLSGTSWGLVGSALNLFILSPLWIPLLAPLAFLGHHLQGSRGVEVALLAQVSLVIIVCCVRNFHVAKRWKHDIQDVCSMRYFEWNRDKPEVIGKALALLHYLSQDSLWSEYEALVVEYEYMCTSLMNTTQRTQAHIDSVFLDKMSQFLAVLEEVAVFQNQPVRVAQEFEEKECLDFFKETYR